MIRSSNGKGGLLAQRLLQEAWSESGPLGRLTEAERAAVRRVAESLRGLFCRSSSCVEGRNSHLSLHHHGQGSLEPAATAGVDGSA